jgi:hypothetical protein
VVGKGVADLGQLVLHTQDVSELVARSPVVLHRNLELAGCLELLFVDHG